MFDTGRDTLETFNKPDNEEKRTQRRVHTCLVGFCFSLGRSRSQEKT